MFSVILATDLDQGIGKHNDLPWHFPDDLKNFKHLTTGQVVVMGRKTWDSLPKKPLPQRVNIIISSSPLSPSFSFSLTSPDILVIPSFDILIEFRRYYYTHLKWFIIGGSSLYDYFFDHPSYIDTIYWTLVLDRFQCDTFIRSFIPRIANKPDWKWSEESQNPKLKYYVIQKIQSKKKICEKTRNHK